MLTYDWTKNGGQVSPGAILPLAAPSTPVTDAMNRYPRRGIVSINRGLSAESPSASRSLMIAVFRLLSKSTKVSADQFWERSSSRVTTSPGRCSSSVST